MRKTYTELTAIFLVLCTISVGHSQDEGKQEVGKKEKARKDLTMQWVTAADGTANVAEWAAYADNRFVYLADYAAAAKDAVETDKAMLGVHVREADATLRQHLDINGGFGLVVEHVTEKVLPKNRNYKCMTFCTKSTDRCWRIWISSKL